MTDRELMQQALEALEAADWYIDQLEPFVYAADDKGTHEERVKLQIAITALRLRLAQPEQGQWDAIPDAFNEWWNADYDDADYDDTGNPYRKGSPAYWAWSGWSAANKEKNK